jgi:mRNA-degrading endonuclease YafQ of YafQ-DinJ toxin-antitoxin module
MNLSELFEEDGQKRLVVATQRFFKEYPKFAKKYTSFKNNLKDFLLFRETARVEEPYGNKDAKLAGNIWRDSRLNLRRVHLIHGKAIVIYGITNEIRLVMIGEHDDIEGTAVNKLVAYARSLTPEDYAIFEIPDDEPEAPAQDVLNKQQAYDLKSVFLLLSRSPDDRRVLQDAANGKIDDFMDWARMTLDFDDDSHDQAIMATLGGRGMLMKNAAEALSR